MSGSDAERISSGAFDKGMRPYAPINKLKPVCDDVWIVDGPVIRFGLPWPRFPFTTRMTIIRLSDGGLFVHSPTEMTEDLRAAVDALGPVRVLLGPNRIHFWWLPEWRAAYPDAQVWIAPKIREHAKGRIDFPAEITAGETGYPWDADLKTLPIVGDFMTEVEIFHPASRTLVLTDFIENFELKRVKSPLLRWLIKLDGLAAPNGRMPRDMRLTFLRQRKSLSEAVRKMIAWDPERVIIAHGKWFERDGAQELRRAFAWLL
ncbi:MAG: DUF4336 domain-containing protein [Hyphomonadaceae bacterium]